MIGVDEVGRGAWAGPLLVVAARLKVGHKIPVGLKDSKQLTKKQRTKMAIQAVADFDIGQGWVSADMVDTLGLAASLKSATLLALMNLDAKFDEPILIDGTVNFIKDSHYNSVQTKIKADESEPIVSAASIVAKVLRDEFMAELAEEYPNYGFEKHVGYGTAAHMAALKQFGVCALHRKSYKPIKKYLINDI